jgi:glycine/D-amino acid oxidase-like deaminating enzyme
MTSSQKINIEHKSIITSPYWWEAAPRPAPAIQTLPASVNVAIIGAGYTGLNVALVLARAGLKVAVFEARQLGSGASTLNGGMVGPSFHKLGVAGLKAKFGTDRANAILKESLGFVDYLERFLTDEKIDADFSRVGRFSGALQAEHYDAMARELDILKHAIDIKGEMVLRKDQATETGSALFQGGIVYHQDAGLHPGKYHDGLVRRVLAVGAEIYPETRVIDFIKSGSKFSLTTTRGGLRQAVDAEQVAVCTNGYTGRTTPTLRRRVLPLRSAMIATEPLSPELMNKLMPRKRLYGDSRRLVAYYRPSPDGKRILFGGRAASLKDNPKANAQQLKQSMSQVYPELSAVGISHVWSGLVAYTFDHVPHLGQIDGAFYAMGYCGSGVARSSYFGMKLGLKILGSAEAKTSFDDLNFETHPLYFGNPWFMPFVLGWHRVADRLGW